MVQKMYVFVKKKEQVLTQSYDENPYTNRKFNNKLTTQKLHQNFENTPYDRVRTVSSSNNIHPTGVVKPVYGYRTFPLTANVVGLL